MVMVMVVMLSCAPHLPGDLPWDLPRTCTGLAREAHRGAARSERAPICDVPDNQAVLRRRRHQPRRPPVAKIRPGSPAPARAGLMQCSSQSLIIR